MNNKQKTMVFTPWKLARVLYLKAREIQTRKENENSTNHSARREHTPDSAKKVFTNNILAVVLIMNWWLR